MSQQLVPQHVIIIGIDGLSVEGLKTSVTPNLDTLRKRGCISYKTRCVMPSVSTPNWSSILSGAGPEQTGVTSNTWTLKTAELPPTDKDADGYFPSIFQVLREQIPQCKLGMFYDWDWLGTYINPKYISVGKLVKGHQNITNEAISFIKTEKPLLTFVYYGLPDEVMHEKGMLTPEYKSAVHDIDTEIGKIIEATKKAGFYGSTVFMVVSDHGGVGKEHGGLTPAHMEVPWMISGPGIRRGVFLENPNDVVNTAPTLMILLNLYMPDSWIGRPYVEAFSRDE